jgi:hypothetical protein
MKVSHTQLEDCRSNPRSWVRAKVGPEPFFSMGYNQGLLHAIHRYHRSNGDADDARQYLQALIDRNFENQQRSDEIQDWLESYMNWCRRSKVVVADTKFRIKLNLGVMLELRGEMHRLDVLPNGYRALLLGAHRRTWESELRMPLLQLAVSRRYGRPPDSITVGVQHLDGSSLATRQYSQSEIRAAEAQFRNLSGIVEGYARNQPGLLP